MLVNSGIKPSWIVHTCLDGSQPLNFPLLKSLERFLKLLFEPYSLAIKLPDSNTICLICLFSVVSRSYMGRLSLTSIESLGYEAGEGGRLFLQILLL